MKRQALRGIGLSVLGAAIGLLASVVVLEASAGAKPVPSKGQKTEAPKTQKSDAPRKTKALFPGPEGLHFGLTSESIASLYDRVFDEAFLPRYRTVSPGIRMQELDQELAEKKSELRRRTDFTSEPLGGASHSPISQEFTYGNHESMTKTVLSRMLPGSDPKQKREVRYLRRFFFFGDKVWKIYDEYKLGEAELFDSFQGGKETLDKELKSKAQLAKADPSSHRDYDEATWTIGDTVVKLINREDDKHLALVYIDKSVLDNLGRYRTNKQEVEHLSPEVSEATSKAPPKDDKQTTNPADAYTKKRHH